MDSLVQDLSLLVDRLRKPLKSEDIAVGWNDDAVTLVRRMMEEAQSRLVSDRIGPKWAHDSSLGRTLDMRWGIYDGDLLSEVLGIGIRLSEFPRSRLWRRK
jgi:hypothetical protein